MLLGPGFLPRFVSIWIKILTIDDTQYRPWKSEEMKVTEYIGPVNGIVNEMLRS